MPAPQLGVGLAHGVEVEGADAGDGRAHGAVGHETGRPAQVLAREGVAPAGDPGALGDRRRRGHDRGDGGGVKAELQGQVDVLRAVAVQQLGDRRRRRRADALLQALAVGDGGGAQGADVVEVALAGDADDGGAGAGGQLHRHRADAARGRADDEDVAGRDVERAQRPAGRLGDDPERGGPDEVEGLGLGHDLVRRDDEPLGQGPGAGPLAGDGADGAQDRVAHGEGVDALADGVDDARVVAPDPLRGRRGVAAHHAGEDLPVHRVEARRPHRDPDLPGARRGLGDLDHLQDLRAAEAPVLDRSHHDHASLVARLLWSPAVRPGAARRRRPAVMTSAQPPGRRTFTMISI